jgi:mannose-1-phosphate guanylyltransferase
VRETYANRRVPTGMIRSIVHAGGESTRLKEIYDGPKALAPVGKHTLLWYHLQPLVKCKLIREYTFTLRHRCEIVEEYLDQLKTEYDITISTLIEPKPLGRAGAVRFGIEKGIIHTDEPYLMSNPDDLVPIRIDKLIQYASKAEKAGKTVIMIMAKKATTPFGIGIAKKAGQITELKEFQEKPELPFIPNHYANTGMTLFMPDAMQEFKNVPLDRPTNPENEMLPRLVSQNKVAVFPVNRWLSVNYAADYKNVLSMGQDKLAKFLELPVERLGTRPSVHLQTYIHEAQPFVDRPRKQRDSPPP